MVVVLEVVVVVCMPPAGVGVVLVVLDELVVDAGPPGVAGVVTVVPAVEDDDVVGGVVVVVCATESGTAIAKLTHSAPAASSAFTLVPPGRASAVRH